MNRKSAKQIALHKLNFIDLTGVEVSEVLASIIFIKDTILDLDIQKFTNQEYNYGSEDFIYSIPERRTFLLSSFIEFT
jgi:hypothetical protein